MVELIQMEFGEERAGPKGWTKEGTSDIPFDYLLSLFVPLNYRKASFNLECKVFAVEKIL
jgi:hypothetical protein